MLIRQWQIIEALRARRRGLTVPTLIELTRVSRATVYRDLELLEQAGVPLLRERIAGEVRHRLADVRGVSLASHEIAALALARQMLDPLEGLRVVESLDALLRRVGRARGVAPPVGLAGARSGDHRGTVRAIDLAIRNGHRIGFDYRAATTGKREHRRVDPVSIRLHRGQPYLVGFDADRDDWRIFKVTRIYGEIALEGPAEPRPDYDDNDLFRHSIGVWSGEPVAVAVRLAPGVASRADEYPLIDEQTVEAQADGAAVVRATVSGLAEVLRWVLAWGGAAEVLEPEELRDAVCDELTAALRRYDGAADPGNDQSGGSVSHI